MRGIDREIILDRRHLAKHLPNTPQSNRLLRRGRADYVFNDEDTLLRVAQAIILEGIHTGFSRGYDRYGLMFTEAIGIRIDPDGSTLPLFYGEVKIDADDKYHPIPRTRPIEE
ncbi:MAG: hypothetical protein F6K16_33430 [Symploca sp. SIO2B6]|nr:hypothetical protein [Symploca sp. SIO2B6]